MNPRKIAIADFTYDLPNDRIATHPLAERDQSKLLVYDQGIITDHQFSELPELLPENALVVFNNTKVIHARLRFQKASGSFIEIFCLEPIGEYQTVMQSSTNVQWICMIGGLNKWKETSIEKEVKVGAESLKLRAEREAPQAGGFLVRFSWNNESVTFAEILHAAGDVPLPPYIKRSAEKSDDADYQTVFAKHEGSVAAPTASLHFTDAVLQRMEAKGILTAEVTLHVGAGTFKPVKAKTLAEHDMHGEWISIPKSTVETLLKHQGPVVAGGTTALRTLETIYWLGLKAARDQLNFNTLSQWEAYDLEDKQTTKLLSLQSLLSLCNNDQTLTARTSILIAPGYKFRMADMLITNFHQPNSTLLLLIAAAVGEDWRKIYRHALDNDYRFLSYGDASLLKIKKDN